MSPEAPMAVCPNDDTPLIQTLAFSGAEFYCLTCGAHIGYTDPKAAKPTPELDARYDALEAEWNEHVAGKLRVVKGWFDDCEKCKAREETHDAHATTEEIVAHQAALDWLEQRKIAGATS